MNYKIVKYESTMEEQWNGFLKTCKNYHFMFERRYMEYHSDRFRDCSLLVYDEKDKIVALLPGNIREEIFYSHQGLTFGGLLIDQNMRTNDLLLIFDAIKVFLKALNILKINYKCIPYIYHKYPAQEDLYVLFRNHAKLYRRDISCSIELGKDYKFSKVRKRGINKAKKHNIVCVQLDKPSEIWSLIKEVLNQHHDAEPVHSEKEIDHLKDKFPNNINCYAAVLDKKIIAGVITYETDGVIHTQYLASNDLGRETGALDLLIAHIIEKIEQKFKFFDFGISNEDNGWFLNEGLINQKESFGGRAIVHDFYTVDLI